jgi:hypothetical protein
MNICVVLPITLALTGASFAVAQARNKVSAGGAVLLPTHELRYEIAGDGRAQNAVVAGLPGLSFSPSSAGARSWMVTNAAVSKSNRWIYLQPPRGFALAPRPNTPNALPPGVYESEPYKCIVVVPGPQWDDRCLVSGGDPTAPMPVRKPELRLVPRPN